MNIRWRNVISLFLNAFVLISTFIIVISGIAQGAGEGALGSSLAGLGYLRAFTTLSNILNGLAAFAMICFNINSIVEDKDEWPRWVIVFQYVGASAVFLTFATVMGFLGPRLGYGKMLANDMFFFHLLNPLASIITCMFVIPKERLTIWDNFLAIVPTEAYSIFYIIMVINLRKMDDFYGFMLIKEAWFVPVGLIVIYLISFALALIIRLVHNATAKAYLMRHIHDKEEVSVRYKSAFLSLAKARFSTREFDKKKKVENKKIQQILDAARLAPSAKNQQPVRIYVVKSDQKLAQLEAICPCTYNAPMAFIICADRTVAASGMVREGYDFGEMDASIACTHMMLEATDIGLGSCWVGRFSEDEVREALDIPDKLSICAILPVGYTARDAGPSDRHLQRRKYEEMVEEI